MGVSTRDTNAKHGMKAFETETQRDPNNRLPLRIEAAPAFGQGTIPDAEESRLAMLCHLIPVIIRPWKRQESPVVDAHGKEALNMSLMVLAVFFSPSLAGSLLGPGFAAGIVSCLISLAMVMLVMTGALMARAGWLLRHPFNLRVIK